MLVKFQQLYNLLEDTEDDAFGRGLDAYDKLSEEYYFATMYMHSARVSIIRARLMDINGVPLHDPFNHVNEIIMIKHGPDVNYREEKITSSEFKEYLIRNQDQNNIIRYYVRYEDYPTFRYGCVGKNVEELMLMMVNENPKIFSFELTYEDTSWLLPIPNKAGQVQFKKYTSDEMHTEIKIMSSDVWDYKGGRSIFELLMANSKDECPDSAKFTRQEIANIIDNVVKKDRRIRIGNRTIKSYAY